MTIVEEIEEPEVPKLEEIDPRIEDDMTELGPIEELEEIILNPEEPTKTVKLKRRPLDETRYAALMEEVDKTPCQEFYSRDVLSHLGGQPIFRSKTKWEVAHMHEFTDLNKACSKDCFLLPRIDQLVDAIAKHKLM
uniref:Uncharacterized protein n=1 Tax=Cannabis sativa TaxID=3483 RepID=A0A803NLZ0_CANSA